MVNMAAVRAAKPDPEGKVFISYRRDDGEQYANEIGALLRAVGLRIWRDIYDMPAGNTPETLERVLVEETAAGVLIVTPKIYKSNMIINHEAPILRSLANNPEFPLAVANSVLKPDGEIDYDAPDRMLRTYLDKPLGEYNQFNLLKRDEVNKLVTTLLRARILYVAKKMREQVRDTIVIDLQSRTPTEALESVKGDLQVRINPDHDNSGKLSKQGLEDLKVALPIMKNALEALPQDKTVRLTGGMHLTPALAVGATFPSTKPGTVEVLDNTNELWRSEHHRDVPDDILSVKVNYPYGEMESQKNRIAIMVSLTNAPDYSIFDEMIKNDEKGFDNEVIISLNYENIDPRWAAALSERIVKEIRELAKKRSEIHLAFHGPVAMAILVGRLLNTYKVIAYERLETTSGYSYQPVLKIDVGAVAPIQEVYGSPGLGNDGLKRAAR